MVSTLITLVTSLFLMIVSGGIKHLQYDNPPNVILIMTDDQGIGDLGCHGNPWIKTPNLNKFHQEAYRMTDFHVSPLCTPTRGAIMTGRYPVSNGTWATFKGRDALHEGTTTLADIFSRNGYRTGIFGKWHLGDNYPVRPTDCGFEVAVHHKAGGIGELSDYWGNSYFDDVYFVNNEPQEFKGYCTDVWFSEAMKFMENTRDKPFFVYLPTNAPHDPYIVDSAYAAPYRNLEGSQIVSADFYGMISNIDENFGKLERFLHEKGLADNTILIFLTDNGSSGGISRDGKTGYNMGLRGRKGSKTEGGHRVPFFIRWPEGGIQGGRDIPDLTGHVDILPTLAGLCGLPIPSEVKPDGIDFSDILLNKNHQLPQRPVFVHHRQDWRPPMDIEETCLMEGKWRLINGRELYDMEQDPYQSKNIADAHPEIVKRLLDANDGFLEKVKAGFEYHEMPVHVIGNENQKEITLTIQHAIGEGPGIWKAQQVAEGMKNINNTHALKVEKAGVYLISCRRWPKECPGPVLGIPDQNPKGGMYNYQPISPEKVRIKIANQIIEKTVNPSDTAVVFNVYLEKGKTFLVNDFIEKNEAYGVYYTYIKLLENNH